MAEKEHRKQSHTAVCGAINPQGSDRSKQSKFSDVFHVSVTIFHDIIHPKYQHYKFKKKLLYYTHTVHNHLV